MAADDLLQWRIGLVGYGEVGRILAEDLRAQASPAVSAYDLKLGGAVEAPLREHADRCGVKLTASHRELASDADLVVSAVTASQAVPVAEACAPALRKRCLLPGPELGLAGRQAARRPPHRRSGRPLRRGGGDDRDRALPPPRADAPGRPARRRPRPFAQCGRLRRQGRVRRSRAKPPRPRCAAA